jgi:hypothetical protein
MSPTLVNIGQARDLLVDAEEPAVNPLATLAAAALAAIAAILMAGVMVLGPGMALDHPRPSSEVSTF